MPAGSLTITTTHPRRSTRVKENNAAKQPATVAPTATVDVEPKCYDSDESELTPLSSPVVHTSPVLEIAPGPQRSKGNRAVEHSTAESTPLTGRRPPAPNLSESRPGSHVWVLLDREARVFEPNDTENNVGSPRKEWIWWPAKVTDQTIRSTKVALYGSPILTRRTTEIRTPSDANIQSIHDSKSRLRYTVPPFVDPVAHRIDAPGSPRKRQKLDRSQTEQRWRQGLDELRKDQQLSTFVDDSDDDMPAVGTLGFDMFTASLSEIPESGTAMNQVHSKRKRSNSEATSSSDEGWSPPPADDMLSIPGEGVIAADREHNSLYWPARVLEYIPPKRRKQKPKYRVEFLDTTQKEIPRDWFYTTEQDEFVTCKLGRWESLFKEVQNDEDGDLLGSNVPRSPSPEPLDPPPEPYNYIVDLSTREQMSYTKPVLQAILKATYKPAIRRHSLYMAGGQSRKMVVDEAGLRGTMDPKDVSELQEHLNEWCLREEKRPKKIQEDLFEEGVKEQKSTEVELEEPPAGSVPSEHANTPSPAVSDSTLSSADIPPTSLFAPSEPDISADDLTSKPAANTPPHRQYGCEEYEALPTVEKIDYCLNVLLPEAVLQILLWRKGYRRSVQLLTDEEEEEVYQKGLDLVRERDWVSDIMRVRELREAVGKRNVKLNKGMWRDEHGNLYSATGRQKRNIAVPKSYVE